MNKVTVPVFDNNGKHEKYICLQYDDRTIIVALLNKISELTKINFDDKSIDWQNGHTGHFFVKDVKGNLYVVPLVSFNYNQNRTFYMGARSILKCRKNASKYSWLCNGQSNKSTKEVVFWGEQDCPMVNADEFVDWDNQYNYNGVVRGYDTSGKICSERHYN